MDTFAHAEVVLNLAHSRNLASDIFSSGLLRGGIDETAERYHALIGIHIDLETAHIWIGKQGGFHPRGDCLVVQVFT